MWHGLTWHCLYSYDILGHNFILIPNCLHCLYILQNIFCYWSQISSLSLGILNKRNKKLFPIWWVAFCRHRMDVKQLVGWKAVLSQASQARQPHNASKMSLQLTWGQNQRERGRKKRRRGRKKDHTHKKCAWNIPFQSRERERESETSKPLRWKEKKKSRVQSLH